MAFANVIYPTGIGLVIRTGDVTVYNGQTLHNVAGDSLNDILKAIDDFLDNVLDECCSDTSTLSNYDGAALEALSGANLNAIIESADAAIKNINDTLSDIADEQNTQDSAITAVANSISSLGTEVDGKLEETDFETFYEKHHLNWSEGAIVSSSLVFVVTIGACVVWIDGTRVTYAGGTISATPSKDNYIYLDKTGTLLKNAVNNGDPQPTIADSIILVKAVTDGAGVTALSDIYIRKSIDGASIKDSSIPVTALTDNTITSAKLTTTIGGDAGTYSAPQIEIDEQGRITAVTELFNFAGLADGDTIVYDNASGKFINVANGGFPDGSSDGDIPQWDSGSGAYIPTPQVVSNNSDVSSSTPSNRETLVYNGTNSRYENTVVYNQWKKYTLDYTDFQGSGGLNKIVALNPEDAGDIILRAVIIVRTTFTSSGTLSTAGLTLEDNNAPQNTTASVDMKGIINSGETKDFSPLTAFMAAATPLQISAKLTITVGDASDLDDLTAGEVDIYLEVIKPV